MTNNVLKVVTLPKREPPEAVLLCMADLQKHVETGDVRSLVFIAVMSDEDVVLGKADVLHLPFTLLGALEVLKHDIVERALENAR